MLCSFKHVRLTYHNIFPPMKICKKTTVQMLHPHQVSMEEQNQSKLLDHIQVQFWAETFLFRRSQKPAKSQGYWYWYVSACDSQHLLHMFGSIWFEPCFTKDASIFIYIWYRVAMPPPTPPQCNVPHPHPSPPVDVECGCSYWFWVHKLCRITTIKGTLQRKHLDLSRKGVKHTKTIRHDHPRENPHF